MRFFLCLLFAISARASFAQDWAKKRLEESPRHQEWVEMKSGTRTLKCFVVYPERKDKAPVVLVIHEIFGLSDWAMSFPGWVPTAVALLRLPTYPPLAKR